MQCRRAPDRMRGVLAVALVTILCAIGPRTAGARSFDASAVAVRDGQPALIVDGRPFFFYGAAFFYERIPADRWRDAMLALRTLGFNTLDLYVPWNWHELGDGDFDFDGHSNARRNLRGVLALAHELHFKLVVRPGPVIRNEWRNGGYPAWLLTRPEYGMPLHDVLEGRYPATATLQNANSDDAAAQWLANGTHMHYATRWLQAVLRELTPVADSVIAIQLDDDQGAYIDNQTWPAPHFQTYVQTLAAIVRSVAGSRIPLFINTYEMKVTASAPVWAMGNWYQSEAFSIGEHDRTALEFSAGLLQTQAAYPLAISEFQAGWLAPPEDPQPRPADPTNTTLALHTLLGMGMRGVIDFPAQDTVNPAGWEAPFANASYAWDAALDVNLQPSPRYAPTKRFGDLVRANGGELADARRLADGAIAYLTSAYDPERITTADVFAIVARTQQAQQSCRARNLTCDLVDLRFGGDANLARYPFVIVPPDAIAQPFVSAVAARLARYRSRGGRILAAPPDVVSPHAGGLADATVLAARDGAAFVDIVNYDSSRRMIPATIVHVAAGRDARIGPLSIAPRDAVLLRAAPAARGVLGSFAPPAEPQSITPSATPPSTAPPRPPQSTAPSPKPQFTTAAATPQPCQSTFPSAVRNTATVGFARAVVDDRADDGFPRVTLVNDRVALTVAPNAGARAFVFEASPDGCRLVNVFTSVGALRDDVAVQPPLSTTDRIGKYTRSFPAGTFNRSYALTTGVPDAGDAVVRLAYDAPDVIPAGARFERTLTLRAGDTGFDVGERVTFGAGLGSGEQRPVRYDSFDARGAMVLDERSDGAVGFFFPAAGLVAVVAWPAADVEDAQLLPERSSTVLRLRFTPNRETHTRYSLDPARNLDTARAMILKERAAAAAKP